MSRCYICRSTADVEEWHTDPTGLTSRPNPYFCDSCSLRVSTMGMLPASILHVGDMLVKILMELESQRYR